MGWVAFAVTFVVAVGLGMTVRRRYQDDLAELQAASRLELDSVKSDARGRVDRLERESGRQKNDARDGLVKDLMPALDAFASARQHVTDDDVRAGLDLVAAEFNKGLARHEIEEISPDPGDAFQPELHEAVESVETYDWPPGTIGRCHRAGYRSGDKTLRPALVGVVRAPSTPEAPGITAEEE